MSSPERVELHEGFWADVSAQDEASFAALQRDWSGLRPLLADEALALEQNYREGALPEGASPEGVWAAMVGPAVRCRAPGYYELTCRFRWQAEEDPHSVTFYVEDGEPRGCSFGG